MNNFSILTPFIISQILMIFAMITDFASLQFKNRKYTIMCFVVSSIFICVHYLLLDKLTAWIMAFLWTLRFIVSYFTTDKRVLLLFIALNTIVLFFTFQEIYDFIFYAWIIFLIVWNFQDQKHNKLMRILMMMWTALVIIYNAIIFSPMWIVVEVNFLISNLIGYYRFYIKKKN